MKFDIRNSMDSFIPIFVMFISFIHFIVNLIWLRLIVLSEVTWTQILNFIEISPEAFFWILISVTMFDFLGIIVGIVGLIGRDKNLDKKSS